MRLPRGILTITRRFDDAEFNALLDPRPEAKYTVVYRLIRPSLRHPVQRWRWRRDHGRIRSITTTFYDCTLERRDGDIVITPDPIGGDIPGPHFNIDQTLGKE